MPGPYPTSTTGANTRSTPQSARAAPCSAYMARTSSGVIVFACRRAEGIGPMTSV